MEFELKKSMIIKFPLNPLHVFSRFIFKFPLLLFRPQLLHAISHPPPLLQYCRRIGGLKGLHFASQLVYLNPNFGVSGTRFWNLSMKGQSDVGSFDLTLRVFLEMRRLGVQLDSFTLPIVNHAISMLRVDVFCGQMIHCVGFVLGFGLDVYFCNTLIEVYVKCGDVGLARKVFDEMSHRDLVSWTSMASGYASEGNTVQAFELFNEMRAELQPNSVTIITILQACLSCASVIQGKQLHCYLIKAGFLDDGSVRNSLLKVYSNWISSEDDLETLFHKCDRTDAVPWNILISFHISKGDVFLATQRFNDMLQDVTPSAETLTIVATALLKSGDFNYGQLLHCLATKSGLCDHVLLTCFLNLYAKYGDLDSSTRLFGELLHINSVAWSSMMSGLVEHGHHEEAVELFKQTEVAGLQHEPEIVGSLLDGYAGLGALHKGKEIHAYFLRNLAINSLETNSVSETSILNMYARCGSISCARNCFRSMVTRDVIAWTSMIEGLGTYGLGLEAIELFNQMLNEGVSPNSITFLSLLSACAHSGLATEGCKLFNAMKWNFGFEPELYHYTCMVDLLGRSGKLREALCMILKMKCCQDSRIWGALLAASRTYMDRKIGGYAAKRLLEREPRNVGYRVVLSNIKASAEQWDEVEAVRRRVKEMDLKKAPGWSCVEAKGRIIGFVSWDTSHSESGEICGILGFLMRQMQDDLGVYSSEQIVE